MKKANLTDRQNEVLLFIRHFIEEKRYPPSIREIMAGLSMSSTNGTRKHLQVLESKGHINLTPGIARGISLR